MRNSPGSDDPGNHKSVHIEALSPGMVDHAAALIAREHQHVRDQGVPVPPSYLDVAACGSALTGLLTQGFSAFVARHDGLLVGVMCGRTFDGVGFVPAHGVALDPHATDPTRVMAELFANLAPVLVAGGAARVTIDQVDHKSLAGALFDLGFGRGGVFAVRDTEPVDADPSIEVRAATAADLYSIAALSHVEFLYRSTPPMYALEHSRTLTETHAVHERLLHDGATHLLARRSGHDVGLLTIEQDTPAPRLCALGCPYIGATATDPNERRNGIGRALVSASLEWARAAGHDAISVDFDSRNPVSRQFWLGNGFQPTGHRLRRILALPEAAHREASS